MKYNVQELFGQAAQHHVDGRVVEVAPIFSRAANPDFAPKSEPSTPVVSHTNDLAI
jgi:hypothetical protein